MSIKIILSTTEYLATSAVASQRYGASIGEDSP